MTAQQSSAIMQPDLLQELRDRIYRELLVLKDSFTCHPQIVRASKNINAEASGILYGDNLIEIKVHHDGIYVHGQLSGTHQPDRPRGQEKVLGRASQIKWPQLLSKARFIRFEIVILQQLATGVDAVPNLGTLHAILYSLCSFLQDSHTLRSLALDLR